MRTEQQIEAAVRAFKLRCHEQPSVRPEKWDAWDRAAVLEILEAAGVT